ncbi:hypothetical protein ABFB09_03855 [Dehalogenimonas sp. THU2]|uniref:hypothetical protein n=1 Tax=Dehalogenimonas sp. THU2 TaxID=3151121 RepID=UPI0032183467
MTSAKKRIVSLELFVSARQSHVWTAGAQSRKIGIVSQNMHREKNNRQCPGDPLAFDNTPAIIYPESPVIRGIFGTFTAFR